MKISSSSQVTAASPRISSPIPATRAADSEPARRRSPACAPPSVGPAGVESASDALAPCEVGQVEPYRAVANAIRETARSHFSDGVRALEQLGVTGRPDPQRLVETFAKVLSRARLDGADAERSAAVSLLALMGVRDWDHPGRVAQVRRMFAALGDPPDLRQSTHETTVLTRYLLREGARTRARWEARVAELAVPSTRRPHDDLFFTLSEFPNLAQAAYRSLDLEGVEHFPPRASADVPMNAKAERFVGLVEAWQREHRNTARAEAGLLVAGAILVGVLGSFVTGPGGGAMGAAVIGIGGTVVREERERQFFKRTEDAYRLGLASAETVQFHADELAGAQGALVVSLVTAGIASRLGVSTVPSSFVKQLLLRQGRSIAIGTGAGAAIALVHPRTWHGPDTMGAIVEGTVWGAASGVIGGAFGSLSAASTRVAIMFAAKPTVPITDTPVRLRLEDGREIAARVVSLIPQLGILTAQADDGSKVQIRLASLRMVHAPTPSLEALAAATDAASDPAPSVATPARVRTPARRRRVPARRARRATRRKARRTRRRRRTRSAPIMRRPRGPTVTI